MKAVDVMGFGGSFAAGVDQAGFDIIAKREPAKFKGFGMETHVYNMPWLDAQVAPYDKWDLPPEDDIDLVYGCPPCSGFSALSFANKRIHGTIVGEDAEINQCMRWLIDYAARVKPSVVVLESVGIAFKNGRGWMEGLWEELREKSGVDYMLTHVNMNASLVGGDAIRPRYFFVAHTEPFGVGLEFVQPRTASQVLADLPAELDEKDTDWGHSIYRANGPDRMIKTMRWLREEHGRVWKPGTRLPQNIEGLERQPPDFWLRPDGKTSPRNPNQDIPVYSHWFSTDPFATFRWYPDKPFGVVVAAVLDRAIHPVHDRTLTWREAARFMSIPDTWSLRMLVEANSGAELGKAVPAASGKWIAHWARMSIEGTPGEFAGVVDTDDDRIRVISVQNQKQVDELKRNPPANSFWDGDVADPDPATWLIDRKERPRRWPQRDWLEEDGGELDIRRVPDDDAPMAPPKASRTRRNDAPGRARTRLDGSGVASRIERVPPETVAALIAEVGIDKKEAARRLGVSVSRVNELTTHTRPGSWLNAQRWDEVQEKLRRG